MQQCSENLEKSEERRLVAQVKLTQVMETAEDAKRFVARFHLLLFYKLSNIPYIYIYIQRNFYIEFVRYWRIEANWTRKEWIN